MRQNLPLTLGDTLEDNAVRFADEPAYATGERTLSHGGLLDRAKRLASALEARGLVRQDRIGILSMNSIEFGEVLAATQWSGLILATVNFRLAPPEMAAILGDCTPSVLFFEEKYLADIERMRPELNFIQRYVCIGGRADWCESYEDLVASGDPRGSSFHAREEDIACLVYTGGTTGRPKGCIMGQRETRASAQILGVAMRAGPMDRTLLVMPLFHIGAMAIGLGTHFFGGCVVLHRQFDPGELLKAVGKDGVTILHLAPTLVQRVIDHPEAGTTDFRALQTLVYSAAAMPLPLLLRGMEMLGTDVFVNLYGQTEVITSGLGREHHRPNGTEAERRWLNSVGHPFPNTRVRIVDDRGQECQAGQPGEISVQSVAMARGYWNNHAATLEVFRDGWCRTGDVGFIDTDGRLYLVDRKKDVIISGGENIYSREVEDAVLAHPAVSECAVIGVPDAVWGEAVCAVIVARPGASVDERQIIEHTRALIAGYKKPRHVRLVDELPKLATGKVDKVALRRVQGR